MTLGEHEEKIGWGGSSQTKDLRVKSETAMKNYLHDVSREYKLNPGNSIVRNYNVHSNRYFSIEQEVTVTVQAKDTGWLSMTPLAKDPLSLTDLAAVLAWTDAGQHLGNGPPGP